MTLDTKQHKKIRMDIISFLKTMIDRKDIISSHTPKGNIHFYHSNEKNVELAQPDIICLRNEKIKVIVEVEMSSQPKHLFGVASSINSSDYGSFERKKFDFDRPVLLIIVYSEDFDKKGSTKSFQTQIVQEEIDKNLRLKGLKSIRIKRGDDYSSYLENEINKAFGGELVASTPSTQDELEFLKKFIDFYDYSFWHYKVKSLSLAIENNVFIDKVAKEFPIDGESDKIKRALATEIYFTCLHAIESLFFLIGGFTYKPRNPLDWINNPKQHVNGIAKIFK